MKKIFLFAAAAALLTACSSEELAGVDTAQQNADGNAINFSVYTPRTVTRAGAPKVITTDGASSTTSLKDVGFGIMAYYTDDEVYNSENAKPDFMYNTKVTNSGSGWVYNPVMYWPNEFTDANSYTKDYVSFFAYAPYIDVTNETGIPTIEPITDYNTFAASLKIKYIKTLEKDVTDMATYGKYKGKTYTDDDPGKTNFVNDVNAEFTQTFDLAHYSDAVTFIAGKNLKYIDVEEKTVGNVADYIEYTGLADATAAQAALDEINKEQFQGKNITALNNNSKAGDPIVKYVVDANPETSVDLLWGVAADNTTPYYTPIEAGTTITTGKPFVDMIKPKVPATDKLSFNMLHATAKLNVQIQYVADETMPTTYAATDAASKEINNKETRIYVREVKIGGFVMKGALNLNNIDAGKPLWKNIDGNTALNVEEVIFKDGRKDGKEGIENGKATEDYMGLNPDIVENYNKGAQWPLGKTPGVTNKTVNLFGYAGTDPKLPIFVIPTGEYMDVEIIYDVETRDDNVSTFLSDGITHGVSTENKIKKTSKDIFGGTAMKMEPGKGYILKLLLGMTSVKFEAKVVDFVGDGLERNVNLPDNQ